MIRNKITEFNKKLGIKTEFVDLKEDILGYSENNSIYLSKKLNDVELEKVNKHELLHFFESSKKFEEFKKNIITKLKQENKFDDLLKTYKLKYYGLYTNSQIENGMLETEIAIDILCDNCEIKIQNSQKYFENIINNQIKLVEQRRYLNISLENKIKQNFANLSNWDKLFVQNYYQNGLPSGKDRYEIVKKDIAESLENMKRYASNPNLFKIQVENNASLERHFESEIKALQARGEGETANYALNNKNQALSEMAEKISNLHYEEFKHIYDFVISTNYEESFKYLILNEALTKFYKKDNDKTIVKNRELNKNIEDFITVNDTILSTIHNNLDKYSNFVNLYFAGVEIYNQTIAESSSVKIANLNTFGKGKWLKFNGKTTNEKEYLSEAQKLQSLVKDTPWCTKNLASQQLAQGDFYVFVDSTNKPHIAVKMDGNTLDELRGIQNGDAQELEEEYRDVAIEFLEKNKEIKYGLKWLEKEEWNKRLCGYIKLIESKQLDKVNISNLIEDLTNKKDYKNHVVSENSNYTKLFELCSSNIQVKSKIADYFNAKPDQIYFEDISNIEDLKKAVICFGNVGVPNPKYTGNLDNLRIIFGNAYFEDSKTTSLKNLEKIGGYADFRNSKITDLGNLKEIGGNASFGNCEITSLKNLEKIGGDAIFKNSKITDLGNLKEIGGSAYFEYSEITSLKNLEKIGGYAYFTGSKITNLGNLKEIGGNLYINRLDIKGLDKVEVKGRIHYKDKDYTLQEFRKLLKNYQNQQIFE